MPATRSSSFPALLPDTSPAAAPAVVLAVDDQIANLDLLDFLLADAGYVVETASSGAEALAMVEAQEPSIILLDVMMPEMDGFEVCERLKSSRRTHFIPVVMVTALSDLDSKIHGLEVGADDFLNKPIRRFELLTRIASLLRIRALRDALDSTESVMFSMVSALEGKLPEARDHSLRVATLATAVGRRLELPRELQTDLAWGALLHDLGKIGVPEKVVAATAAERDPEQEALYRQHPEIGAQILEPLQDLAGAREIVLRHHQRLNGSGFPAIETSVGSLGERMAPAIEIVAAVEAWEEICRGDDRAAQLRGLALSGALRSEIVEAVLAASAELPSSLPEPIELVPVSLPDRKGRLYVADDRAGNREILESWIGEAGYEVELFGDGEELLKAVECWPPDLLLVDLNMPGVGGEEVCRRLKADSRYTYLPIILMTAYGESHRDQALESGADEFLQLPLNRHELLARVRSLLRLHAFHLDLSDHETVVLSLSGVLEAKDPYTQGHSARVGDISTVLAQEMGLDPATVGQMLTAGLLHDIGKVAVPQRILHKPARLTDEELEVVKTHPAVGWEICKGLRSARQILPCIRSHHERWDGGGYPDGLVGEESPLMARVLGLADAWDAMTSERPYRRAMDHAKAFAIIEEETAEGKWDPAVFKGFAALYKRGALNTP